MFDSVASLFARTTVVVVVCWVIVLLKVLRSGFLADSDAFAVSDDFTAASNTVI